MSSRTPVPQLHIPPSIDGQPWQAGLGKLSLGVEPHPWVAGDPQCLVGLPQRVVVAVRLQHCHLELDVHSSSMVTGSMFPEHIARIPVSVTFSEIQMTCFSSYIFQKLLMVNY